jgi:hypothetical protein
MRTWLKKIIVLLLALSFLFPTGNELFAKTSSKKKTTAISQAKHKKSVSTSNKTRKTSEKKKRKPRIVVRKVALNKVEILEEKELREGVTYKKIKFGKDPLKIIVHVVEADIDSTPYEVKLLKAKNTLDGLDYLRNIYDDFQFELTRIYNGELLALANANFWSAFMNYPIGIFVAEGEVISMKKYKQWSSVFFDEESRPYIDNFELFGELITPDGKRFRIDNVNRRSEEDNLVIYNKYYGDTLPKIFIKDLEKTVLQTVEAIASNFDFNDSTEVEIDTNEIRNQIILSKRGESKEFSTKKLIFRYLEKPMVNKKVRVEFLGVDTGIVTIPSNGFVVTMPENINELNLAKGAVCKLYFYTNKYQYIPYVNAVSGTPRLVRKGVAKHEAYEEGSRGYRFIGSQLPRTAIGTNMSKTRVYLFVVEANQKSGSLGANLTQLSIIAKRIGCYDAMNLDGGGSSIMIVDGKRVGSNDESGGRRISGAIGIAIKK